MVHKISSVSQGEIKVCKNFDEVLVKLKDDIEIHYELKPIIIFCSKVNFQKIEEVLALRNQTKYVIGPS